MQSTWNLWQSQRCLFSQQYCLRIQSRGPVYPNIISPIITKVLFLAAKSSKPLKWKNYLSYNSIKCNSLQFKGAHMLDAVSTRIRYHRDSTIGIGKFFFNWLRYLCFISSNTFGKRCTKVLKSFLSRPRCFALLHGISHACLSLKSSQ